MQGHLSAFTYHSVHVCVHVDACSMWINYVCGLLINEHTLLKLFHLVFMNSYKLQYMMRNKT